MTDSRLQTSWLVRLRRRQRCPPLLYRLSPFCLWEVVIVGCWLQPSLWLMKGIYTSYCYIVPSAGRYYETAMSTNWQTEGHRGFYRILFSLFVWLRLFGFCSSVLEFYRFNFLTDFRPSPKTNRLRIYVKRFVEPQNLQTEVKSFPNQYYTTFIYLLSTSWNIILQLDEFNVHRSTQHLASLTD